MPQNLTRQELLSPHSEEVQDIVGKVPHWILRWGMGCFALLLIVFLFITWFIRYPDVIPAPLTLHAVNAPKTVVAHSGGKIVKLNVREGVSVKKGEVLAYIESTADHATVLKLSGHTASLMQALRSEQWEKVHLDIHDYKDVGELQSPLQNFYGVYIQLNSLVSNRQYLKLKAILQQDIANAQALKRVLLQQQDIYREDYKLADDEYKMQQLLFRDKVISQSQLRIEESKMLAKKLPVENMAASVISNERSLLALQKELLSLEKEFTELKYTFTQSLQKLTSDIEAWKKQYLLIAPVEGQVSFSQLIQENQDVTAGQEVFYIAPLQNLGVFGEMLVAQNNFGKLALSQKVVIHLESYPSQEYGSLEGRITYISAIPNNKNQYLVRVALTRGLTTNNGYTVSFSNGLVANGEIVTTRTRLIYKLLYPLKGLMQKQPRHQADPV